MVFNAWVDNANNACDVTLAGMNENVSIEHFIQLLQTFEQLYMHIFKKNRVASRLFKEIESGVETTRIGMRRLNIDSTASVLSLLQAEIASNGNDVNKCKDRKTSVVLSILWLNRTLWFVTTIIHSIRKGQMTGNIMKDAYNVTLRRYHKPLTEHAVSSIFSIFPCKKGMGDLIDVDRHSIHTLYRLLTKVYLRVHKTILRLKVNFPDKM
jgi:hypothetical protein